MPTWLTKRLLNIDDAKSINLVSCNWAPWRLCKASNFTAWAVTARGHTERRNRLPLPSTGLHKPSLPFTCRFCPNRKNRTINCSQLYVRHFIYTVSLDCDNKAIIPIVTIRNWGSKRYAIVHNDEIQDTQVSSQIAKKYIMLLIILMMRV